MASSSDSYSVLRGLEISGMLKSEVVVGEKNSILSMKYEVVSIELVYMQAKPIWVVFADITLTLSNVIAREAEYQKRGG